MLSVDKPCPRIIEFTWKFFMHAVTSTYHVHTTFQSGQYRRRICTWYWTWKWSHNKPILIQIRMDLPFMLPAIFTRQTRAKLVLVLGAWRYSNLSKTWIGKYMYSWRERYRWILVIQMLSFDFDRTRSCMILGVGTQLKGFIYPVWMVYLMVQTSHGKDVLSFE